MTDEQIIEDLEKMESTNFSHYSAPKLCTKNARERLKNLQESLDKAVKERDAAVAEAKELKEALHDAWTDIAQQNHKSRQQIRPEPSRLEIAATLVASRFSSTLYVTEVKGTWIKYALEGADALIAAAKEGK
jgi:uncharacterized protein YdbL (DUF1318 family)